MPEALSEAQLSAILAQQIELAKKHDRSERAASRAKALDYYMGDMDKYVPPETNRSKVVSRDVADTIGWMLPQIMRVFTASDRMAVAEPVGPEDGQWAREATDGMNYVFWKDNRGYEVVRSATWDALLVGNGIVKTFFDETPVYATSFHSGLTEDQVALLVNDESVEVLAKTDSTVAGADGQPIAVSDLKIKRKKADGKFVIESIPPEEFLIDGDATFTDEAAFTDHWQRKTRSELVKMGYDKTDVWSIPLVGKPDTAEASSRDENQTGEATDKSMELVDYHECFIRVDVDGDGEAELVRACYAGSSNGKLLDWEVWEDEHPFDDIPCEPIPHRWDARSIADETMDVQDVKTVLERQMLNNTYWNNNPQRVVIGEVANPEELDQPTFGGTVFAKQGTEIVPLPVAYVANHALEQLAYQDEVVQRRTGVGRQSMALDPETLQNQTATASAAQRDAAYSQVEIVARDMAELGWTKVFRKLLKLMVKRQTWARQIMVNGKPIVIDPRPWNADMNVTINVGLGTGSRDRDLAMLGNVLGSQLMLADRFVALGAMEDAIDMLPKVLATLNKMAESAGIRNPEEFYPEYAQQQIDKLKQMASQPKPDPALQLEQTKQQGAIQVEQARGQTQSQLKQVDAQVAAHDAELKAQGDIVKNKAELEADLQTKAADRQNAIELETIKQQGAYNIEAMRLASQEWMKERELEHHASIERDRMTNAQTIAAMKPDKPAAKEQA